MQNTYQKKILDLEAANNAPRIKLEGGKKFKIKSDFQPAGDQPEAIKLLTKNLRDKKNEQVLLGVTGSAICGLWQRLPWAIAAMGCRLLI